MKFKNVIIKFVILAVIFAFLVSPGINPLLGADAKASVRTQLQDTFGALAGGTARGLFSPAKLITLLAMIAGIWLLSLVLNFILGVISTKNKHANTVIAMLVNLIKYIAIIVVIVWGLSILGVNTTAIFASVGVLSLIIGFGAQSLIEDTITGIFIIFENNFNVGDYIVLDEFRGRVVKIGIRTITLIDDGGNLKVVNNSDIRNFQNRSDNLSLAICDVGTSYDADIRKIEAVLLPGLEAMYEHNKDVFEAAPIYKGVEALGDSSVVLRIVVSAKEENLFVARRRLNRELKILFDEKGIEIPFQQIVLHQGK